MAPTVVGIIGVGHLVRHLVPGLLRSGRKPKLLLSARGAAAAADLSGRFGLEIVADNARLVERSEVVLVAVRPFQVEEALSGLPFRSGQTVVSLCAGVPIALFERLAGPATVVRAMPVIAAEYGESPTCIYPENATTRTLFEPAGKVIRLASEDDFEAASVAACYFGWVHGLIGEVMAWMEHQGLAEPIARQLVAGMTIAGAKVVAERPGEGVENLIAELCLPESFTLQGFKVLQSSNAFDPWPAACQALLDRMRKARP